MAINFPLELPAGLRFRTVEWIAENSVAFTESPFSKKIKVFDHGGKRWRVNIGLPTMRLADARRWQAWFLALNGLEGTFRLRPYLESTPDGNAAGAPVIDGASQIGTTLATRGWNSSQTEILKAGDWIQIGDYLHKVTQDASSDAFGDAGVEIWPNLRSSPADGESIVINGPTGIFRLVEIPPILHDVDRLVKGLNFSAIESI